MLKLSNRQYWLVVGSCIVLLIVGLSGAYWRWRSETTPPPAAAKLSEAEFEKEKNTLIDRLKSGGAKASFDYMRERTAASPSFARECHPLLHHLGHAAFTEVSSFSTAMSQADELCNSGFIHGLIEANFMAAPSIGDALASTCPQNKEENFSQWQCFHGTGHGIMYATNKDHTKSLEFCDTLPTDFAASSCSNGVFMEKFIMVSHTGEHTNHAKHPDLSLCSKQKTKHKDDCYFYAPASYLEMHQDQYNDTIQWCRQAEKDYINVCVNGVGSQAMKENIANPSFAAKFCRGLSARDQTDCARGAIGIFIHHNASTAKAVQLCENEFKSSKGVCKAVIGERKDMFNI